MDAYKNPPKGKLENRVFWLQQLRGIILFSFIINLLYLTGPLYMMQVYDRVLASANVSTLLGLSFITLMLYVFFGFLEYIRNQALKAHGEVISGYLTPKAYRMAVLNNCDKNPTQERKQAVSDVSRVRSFLTSPTYGALFDLPWAPIFLLFIFALHPLLGYVSMVAGAFLAALAIINERLSRKQHKDATGMSNASQELVQFAQRNAYTLKGNGMIDAMGARWLDKDLKSRQIGLKGAGINNCFSTITKTLRLILQSLMLGLGAYLVLQGEMSAGSIIAVTVVFGRAIAPLEQILSNYSNLIAAVGSWENIKTWKFEEEASEAQHEMPAPTKSLRLEKVHIQPPNDKSIFLLKNIDFSLDAGDIMGVTGPSGSGKSTLAKALVSAVPAALGKIRLDGADIQQWPRSYLGEHVGYLPQTIELAQGTIAENIARFNPYVDFDKVLEASQLAGTHQLILNMEEGYNTMVGGPNCRSLSGGQLQRVALARAMYGNPFLMVLDEPDSNLDVRGEELLRDAINTMQERNAIVVLVSHRPHMLGMANKLLVLARGEQKAFGSPQSIVEQNRQAQSANKASSGESSPNIAKLTPKTGNVA